MPTLLTLRNANPAQNNGFSRESGGESCGDIGVKEKALNQGGAMRSKGHAERAKGAKGTSGADVQANDLHPRRAEGLGERAFGTKGEDMRCPAAFVQADREGNQGLFRPSDIQFRDDKRYRNGRIGPGVFWGGQDSPGQRSHGSITIRKEEEERTPNHCDRQERRFGDLGV